MRNAVAILAAGFLCLSKVSQAQPVGTPIAENMLQCSKTNYAACALLGYKYSLGEGVAQDLKKAGELFTKACDGGDAAGCSNLGASYANGKGVRQDYGKALEFFGKACDLKEQSGCDLYAKLKALPPK